MSDISFIIQRATSNLTPYRILTGVGIGFSTFFIGGNVAASLVGTMPMISNPAVRQRMGISIGKTVLQWNYFFDKAMPIFSATAFLCSTSFFAASFYVPKVLDARLTRNVKLCLRLAAFCALLPGPYTLTVLAPINNQLKAMVRNGVGSLGTADASKVQGLFDQWITRNSIRIGIYTIPLGLGILSSLII